MKGRVVERDSRAPLAGVRVLLKGDTGSESGARWAEPKASAFTGSDGRFAFQEIDAGRNYVCLCPPGSSQQLVRSFLLADGEDNDVGDIEVPGTATVRGRIVREPGRQPVDGAAVRLEQTADMAVPWQSDQPVSEAKSDSLGRFEFGGLLGESSYQLLLPEHKRSLAVHLYGRKEADVELLLGSAVLRGRTLHRQQPVAASLTLAKEGFSARPDTASEGHFEFLNLEEGVYGYAVRAADRQLGQLKGTLQIAAGEVVEHDFVFAAGEIAGRVVSGKGEPVEGARVTLVEAAGPSQAQEGSARPQSATGGKKGEFCFGALAEGTYSLKAYKEGVGAADAVQVRVERDAQIGPLELRLRPEAGGTLISVALAYPGGEPLPQANIRLRAPSGEYVYPSSSSPRTLDGTQKICDIPPGDYSVTVSASGYTDAAHDVTIESGKTLRLDDVLYEAGEFVWVLRDAQGTPLKDAACRLDPEEGNLIEKAYTGTTDAFGRWTVSNLLPGAYRATASVAGKAPVTISVRVDARREVTRETRIE